MKASVKYDRGLYFALLHEHDIATFGQTRQEALYMLRVCLAGHAQLDDTPPHTPSDVIVEFGGEVVDL